MACVMAICGLVLTDSKRKLGHVKNQVLGPDNCVVQNVNNLLGPNFRQLKIFSSASLYTADDKA